MSDVRDHLKSLERSHRSLTRPDRPGEFTLLGRRWDLLGEVFAPLYSPSTRIGAEFLGLAGTTPHRSPLSLLEIGCGAGVIAVQAALAGWGPVVATDINERAVENTRLNAERHRVTDRVTALHGDLFSALDPGARFDRIFWSSNYVMAPPDYTYRSDHERAYVDPGYRAHGRYLSEVLHHLTDEGIALLHFSDRGDLGALRRIAAGCDRELRTLRTRTVHEGPDPVEHMLLEIRPARERGARPGPGLDLAHA
ncbi:methyltransferase domain-containing protein [Streptomyces sp. 11x1]|uniref:methyltransferase domain-containing protein n=1 Tax=Streptomyces sp. 11x1 TaxID=3038642 RepID=UPI00292E3F15|nr:methyltransferase domain-containing protein [Streptomyces sp. 11x1]WNZ13654.1 methyltransferase domain-containing protein [Streptomyces sp. 11x1]